MNARIKKGDAMRKTILILLLAVASGNAAAEWLMVGESETAVAYTNPTTIRKSGRFVKMWNVLQYRTPQKTIDGKSYLSAKAQEEYDCKEERVRTVYLSFLSKKMGSGDIVFTSTTTAEWYPVVPDSLTEALWKLACGQK